MKVIKLFIAALTLSVSALAFAGPVNINTADAETLAAGLKGVGDAKAQAIVRYRQKNGEFASVQELIEVDGIGPKTVKSNQENLTVGGSSAEK